MAKLKTLTTLNADVDVKQQEFINYYRNTKLYTHFENLVVFDKTNTFLSYATTIVLLGIYPKEVKKTYVHTKTNVSNSFIHNCQNLEATKTTISG